MGTNETAKAEFVKRDPLLAEFYKQEAEPVEIPIFGKHRNQTVIAKLSKDPSIAALVHVAARIHEHWQAADRAAAQDAQRAAQETLRRLEAVA